MDSVKIGDQIWSLNNSRLMISSGKESGCSPLKLNLCQI
jgi:hypothetical protein